MIKMIIMDLDGTLLNNDKNISPYALSILEKCKKIGIKIVFATARSVKSTKRLADLVNPDILILNDGALIMGNNNKVIHKKLLSIDTSQGIIKECIDKNDIGAITMETDMNFYRTYKEPFHPDWGYGIHYDFSVPVFEKAYKISIEIFNEKTALDIGNKFTECKLTCNSGENYYRYSHKEAGKMKAVEIISGYENVQLNDIIAFGDDFNDIEMIERCGIGIAMGNGIDEIKKVAKYICENNDNDGVGKWIEKNVL